MKRSRQFIESCDCCHVQFESIASFKRHCNTQAHTHRQLAEQNAAVMDENGWEIDDTAEPIRVVHHPGPKLILEGQEEEEEEKMTKKNHQLAARCHQVAASLQQGCDNLRYLVYASFFTEYKSSFQTS